MNHNDLHSKDAFIHNPNAVNIFFMYVHNETASRLFCFPFLPEQCVDPT